MAIEMKDHAITIFGHCALYEVPAESKVVLVSLTKRSVPCPSNLRIIGRVDELRAIVILFDDNEAQRCEVGDVNCILSIADYGFIIGRPKSFTGIGYSASIAPSDS
jgi:hypothetical protein